MRVWECRAKHKENTSLLGRCGIGNNRFWWGGMHQENVIQMANVSVRP